ncbi:peptidase M16 [Novosphingobium fuchskuhlense]|uniref:Peptidase M16 n=1 Tax=Novosphingobium fuchskuhlense TaxID=1117702 RepID=A0A117USJ8_9SPHN|nr:pitrilysin family protein [Novosphingobium fuchskuhlense]KUR70080.1 peptidase M16 [Novosphingobium fuchskuhlense]
MPRSHSRSFLATLLAFPVLLAAVPALAADPAAPQITAAPVADLVKAVDIPYERFTLPNGLTVLVHTDRKAPVVAVSVWYKVGSKNEPRGKTGFAHLFEHLMFNGSENAPGDFFLPLKEIGATDFNGTTWFDRTNYFETVPKASLDRALMLESDRMGYLLGAVTQEKLDNQRGVVQNEKRQGDNDPFGLVEYEQSETLYPAGHPYHHSTIGSMADLDSASLDDVKGWFRDHYGPNNAVLVLAGDIDPATAKAKVEKWFGGIPAGPAVQPVAAPVPTLPAPIARTIQDRVATTRIYRMWAIPGLDNPDYLPLQVGALILGGLASSRLDDALVRTSQVAVSASANASIFAQAGQFVMQADVKPGTDPAKVGAALDAQLARLIQDGPTADELARAATSFTAGQIRSLESVGGFGGKASTLAEGLLYAGDPGYYRKELEDAAKLTPAAVRDALARWLKRPAFALTVVPGDRTSGGEARGGDDALPAAAAAKTTVVAAAAAPVSAAAAADRKSIPPAGDVPALDFPSIERTSLRNGIKVVFARRSAVPVVSVRISFDAGYAADPQGARGTTALLLRLMNEGTASLDSSALARAKEALGASISGIGMPDTTAFELNALVPNLAPSLELLAEYVRHPALDPAELERVRTQQLSAIKSELTNPAALATRMLYPAIYGPAHPYGYGPTGTGDADVVKKLTRADLAGFHARWLRPDRATIYVVGDTTLDAVVPLLEKSFGTWPANRMAPPVKDFSAAIPVPAPRIMLIDRPGSPQSLIVGGAVLAAKGTDDTVTLRIANDVLGGDFLSRMNMNLRETKGWSYGVDSAISDRADRLIFRIMAPVQTDQTGPSIHELQGELTRYLGPKGTTAEETALATQGSARELPGAFETSGAVLDGIAKIETYKRPDTWYTTLPTRYRAMTPADLDAAARKEIDPAKLVWVVVGDAAKVKPQLDGLGLPVQVIKGE